jgi:hypothetical protein
MSFRDSLRRRRALRNKEKPPLGTEAKLEILSTRHIPFKSNIRITVGDHRLVAYKKRVYNPKNFDGAFKRGDQILYWHLESNDPKTIIKLLKKGTSPEAQREFAQKGFAGFAGDVPNKELCALYQKFGFSVVKAPISPITIARERTRYAMNVLTRGYPKENLRTPFIRVILRFDTSKKTP